MPNKKNTDINIYKREESKFWYYKFCVNGKNYNRSTKQTQKHLAQRVANEEFEKALASNAGIKPEISIKEALGKYLEHLESLNKRKEISDRFLVDCKNYSSKLLGKVRTKRRIIVEIDPLCLPTTKLSQISKNDINRLITSRRKNNSVNGRPHSEQAIKLELNCLKATLNEMNALGYATPHINWQIDLKAVSGSKRKNRYFTKEEEALILNELDPRKRELKSKPCTLYYQQQLDNFHFMIGLLDTGLRYSELQCLMIKSIDFEKKAICITRKKKKGDEKNKQSVIPLLDRFCNILKERSKTWTENQEYAFLNRAGTSHRNYSSTAIQRAIDKVGCNDDPAKEKATIHTTRHTFISRLLQLGYTSNQIAEWIDIDPRLIGRSVYGQFETGPLLNDMAKTMNARK